MKKALLLAGVLLDLTGVVWILQGFNVLPGSFMTGQMIWAYIGIAVSMVGSVVIWIAVRGGSSEREGYPNRQPVGRWGPDLPTLSPRPRRRQTSPGSPLRGFCLCLPARARLLSVGLIPECAHVRSSRPPERSPN